MRAESPEDMTRPEPLPTRPFTMVVGDDFEPTSGHAFDQAVQMAMRIPGSHLHVVHVARDGAGEAETRRLAGLLRLYISEKCAVDAYMGQSVGIHVRSGEPARQIAEVARDVTADLILVGASAHVHLSALLRGYLAGRLRRISACPVLVVEPKPEKDAAPEPVIAPPCLDCLVLRERSSGTRWWCARHDTHGFRAHRYSFQSKLPFAAHDPSVLWTATSL